MRKLYLLVILFLIVSINIFGQMSAVIKEITGKVEVQPPGSGWQAAAVGMTISQGTMISTGFGATAVLSLTGSTVTVRQLTRMELAALVEKEGTIQTELNLNFGKIDANVFGTENLKSDFSLTSPVSTASVRGTTFSYSGYTLEVEEGTVLVLSLTGQSRDVSGGESIETDGNSLPASGEDSKKKETSVNPYGSQDGSSVDTLEIPKAVLILKLNWE